MTDKLREAAPLLPCPFCGDDGDKGTQAVTLMNAERTSFRRVSCRCCGATCPEPNWNHRAARAQQDAQKKHKPLFAEMIAQHPGLAEELAQQDAQAVPQVWKLVPAEPTRRDSYESLWNALHEIESAAVFLPTFEVTHDGGIEAVTKNIVDAIKKAVVALERFGAGGVEPVN